MESARHITPGRIARLRDELLDEGTGIIEASSDPGALLDELDYALHPPRHEHHVPAYGAIVLPTVPIEQWAATTGLAPSVRQTPVKIGDGVRRYADGITSWTIRSPEGIGHAVVFDRGAGSERDLVVLAEATGAMIVQRRHDSGVRVVGSFGVARHDGIGWHVEPPFDSWLQAAACCLDARGTELMARLLRFAVHDLGASGIGALLVFGDIDPQELETVLDPPPRMRIDQPVSLGPLRHALRQVDGATLFDRSGTLRHLGVRLVPSLDAERRIPGMGGTRHTSGRRFSFDHPGVIVVAVSDSGPVTVFRNGEVVGRSGVSARFS